MRMLTPREVADIFQVCVRTVERLAQTGEIPAKRIGRQWRFVEGVIREMATTNLVIDPRTGRVRTERVANG